MQYHVKRQTQVGPLSIALNWRKANVVFGRFGGGWNWAGGFELGSHTLILNCLVFMLRFDWKGGKLSTHCASLLGAAGFLGFFLFIESATAVSILCLLVWLACFRSVTRRARSG